MAHECSLQSQQHKCDPFYRNETLLCKTSNGDMAENTCGGHFFRFGDFCKIIIDYAFKIYCESFRLKFEA